MRYSEDQKKLVLKLRGEDHLPMEEVARLAGVGVNSARIWCIQAGVRLTTEQRGANRSLIEGYGPEKQAEIARLKMERPELSRQEIAALTGVPENYVKRVVKRFELALPAAERARRGYQAQVERNPSVMEDVRAGRSAASDTRGGEARRAFYASDPEYGKRVSVRMKGWWAGLSIQERQKISEARLGKNSPRVKAILAAEGWGSMTERFHSIAQERGGKLLGEYVDGHAKATWQCAEGHCWQAEPYRIGTGSWCPECVGHISKPQKELAKLVQDLSGEESVLSDRSVLGGLELDVWLPKRCFALEYCGLFWHGERLNPERRLNCFKKHLLAEEAGIRLVTVFEDEWLLKRGVVEGYLTSILGRQARVGARECQVVAGDQAEWLQQHHLQGSARGVTYSLVKDGVVMAAAVFARPNASRSRTPQEGEWELMRYCVGNVGVSGGLPRLIKAFRQDHRCDLLISYSDNRWSAGGLYRSCGFVKALRNRPSYWYFRKGSQVRQHRFSLRKSVLVAAGGDPSKTEWELACAGGWDRIWDAGTTRWELHSGR